MVAHLQPDVAKYAISGFIRVSQALGSKEISQTRVLALQTWSRQGRFAHTNWKCTPSEGIRRTRQWKVWARHHWKTQCVNTLQNPEKFVGASTRKHLHPSVRSSSQANHLPGEGRDRTSTCCPRKHPWIARKSVGREASGWVWKTLTCCAGGRIPKRKTQLRPRESHACRSWASEGSTPWCRSHLKASLCPELFGPVRDLRWPNARLVGRRFNKVWRRMSSRGSRRMCPSHFHCCSNRRWSQSFE